MDYLSKCGIEAAATYLERRGYQILDKEWTCCAGTADIVALEGEWLVFVDVTTRVGGATGLPKAPVSEAGRGGMRAASASSAS